MIKAIGGKTKPLFDHLLAHGFTRTNGSMNALYFVQAEPPNGPVKIGHGNNPLLRWVGIICFWPRLLPLRVIAIIPNAAHLESAAHNHFSSDRLHGEWFNWSQQLEVVAGCNTEEKLKEILSATP